MGSMAEQRQHHQAVDGLLNFFIKSHEDLSRIHLKLQHEFQQIYPDNANPMKLVSRIKAIEEDLLLLKDQCRQLLAAKQDLIDKARSVLVQNRNILQRMQGSIGIPITSDSDDSVYADFNQVIDEWTSNMRSKTGNDEQNEDTEDVNKLLFSLFI